MYTCIPLYMCTFIPVYILSYTVCRLLPSREKDICPMTHITGIT